jgi:hypothetical protein
MIYSSMDYITPYEKYGKTPASELPGGQRESTLRLQLRETSSLILDTLAR